MSHVNRLSKAEAERLDILAEEAAEIIQVVSKIKRHGYKDVNPNVSNALTNRGELEKELGDLLSILKCMVGQQDVDSAVIETRAGYKTTTRDRYTHYQPGSAGQGISADNTLYQVVDWQPPKGGKIVYRIRTKHGKALWSWLDMQGLPKAFATRRDAEDAMRAILQLLDDNEEN